MDIYGQYRPTLVKIQQLVTARLEQLNQAARDHGQPKLYEHLISRIKNNDSMIEKCQRKGYPVSTESALQRCHDAIGFRIVCNFIDDISRNLQALKAADWCQIVKEKDYITHDKPNGYRSYHVILDLSTPYKDLAGQLLASCLVIITLKSNYGPSRWIHRRVSNTK